jgi:opacity protein-like surface antigen
MYGIARNALFAALLAGMAGPALAADYIPEEPIEVVPEVGAWYIRGYLGMSNQFYDGLESDLFTTTGEFGWYDDGGFSSAPIVGAGVGYEFNDYLRGDLTVEWRGKSDFYALDWLDDASGLSTNEYTAKKSELVFMANGYYDFGNFSGFTPYVGAGIGASYNTISHFRDVNVIDGGSGYADDNSEWNLAWALHAGLGFQATERMTIDFGYSFISLGDASTGELHNDDPSEPFPPAGNGGIQFNDIYSHDFKLGVRYSLN